MARPAEPDTPCALQPAAKARPRIALTGPTRNRPSGVNVGQPRNVVLTPASASPGTNRPRPSANPPSTSQSGAAGSGESTLTPRGSRLVPAFSNPPHSTRSPSPRAYTWISGIRRQGSPACHPGTGSVTKYSCRTGTIGSSTPASAASALAVPGGHRADLTVPGPDRGHRRVRGDRDAQVPRGAGVGGDQAVRLDITAGRGP